MLVGESIMSIFIKFRIFATCTHRYYCTYNYIIIYIYIYICRERERVLEESCENESYETLNHKYFDQNRETCRPLKNRGCKTQRAEIRNLLHLTTGSVPGGQEPATSEISHHFIPSNFW